MLRLGHWVVRRRRAVLIASLALFALAGALGAKVAEHLSTGGFESPNSESTRTAAAIEKAFGARNPDILLMVTARHGFVDDPEVAAQGRALTEQLAAEKGVGRVVSYWSLGGAPPLRSTDARRALVLATLDGKQNAQNKTLDGLTPRFTRSDSVVTVGVGGYAEVFRQVTHQVEKDLVRAEMIVAPLLLILLLIVFRSAVAATLPLGVGAIAVVGTLFVLRALSAVTEVSIFAMNLTTAMGLGLGIDYSLFIVSRFREELAAGRSVEDAVARAVATAGRTVVFSAIAVAASLAALLVFPLVFLRSFAYAGIPVLALAGGAATVVLPAALAVIGTRIDRLSIIKRKAKPAGEGLWHRIAITVMKRPVPIATAVVAFLLFFGSPFLHIKLGLPDDRVLPRQAAGRKIHDAIRANFAGNEAFPIWIYAPGVDPAQRPGDVAAYAAALSKMKQVGRVDAATGSYVNGGRLFYAPQIAKRYSAPGATYFSAVLKGSAEPQSTQAEDLVRTIRRGPGPFKVEVTGASAALVDGKRVVFSRFPLGAAIITLITFIVLFLSFGSVLVPIKALLLNLLSLTATFGAMVWVFQEGHFSTQLAFTPTGSILLANIILMFCIAFGLSMDYEVFLLSRIKEEYDLTGDNTASVAVGLERTGRIVTAAAALIAVVMIAFSTSYVSFIKMFGVGLALAVVMDATLVRAALVPAFMRLMGKANWWAPAPMRRIHERFGFSDS
jgi:putative drug exporter of the RND superfamily